VLEEAQVQLYSPGGASVPYMRPHWRNMANMIEPSVCSGDAGLCQLTLTTYYNLLAHESADEDAGCQGNRRLTAVAGDGHTETLSECTVNVL